MAVDAKFQVSRNGKLKTDRSLWDGFYQDVTDYIRPSKQATEEHRTAGTIRTRHYDSTAPHASQTMALIMADTITPKAVRWHGFKLPEASQLAELNDNLNVMRWFDAVSASTSQALIQSNFYPVINEIYQDFNSFATINLYSEEAPIKRKGFNGLNFRALPISSYVFAENSEAMVDTVMREYVVTARQFPQKFPKAKVPDTIAKALKKDPDHEFDFLRVIGPTEELGVDKKGSKPFSAIDIFLETNEVVDTQGYHEFPYHVGRWDKASGEDRGRGPAAIALADIKSLNQLRKLELIGLEKAINPPILAPEDGFIGTVKLGSNSIIYSRNPSEVRLLPTELRLDLSSLKANELKQSIRDVYLTDQLSLPNNKGMTAEEVSTRRNEMERLLGPTIARFESEVLGPMLERVVGMMFRAKALPPPPQELEGITEIEIEYTGQLARSQKMVEVQSIQNWVALIGQFAEMDPNVTKVPNLMAAARLTAPILGVPKQAVNGQEETDKAVAEAAEQQKQMAQQEQLAMMAESAGKAAPAMKQLQESGMLDEAQRQAEQPVTN